MAEYLSEEDMNTGEYISRDETLKIFHQCCDNCTSSYNGVMCRACADAGAMDILIDIPAADVQEKKYCKMIPLELDSRGCTNVFICTNCHQYIYLGFIQKEYSGSYCSECGAEVERGIKIPKRDKPLYTMEEICQMNGVEFNQEGEQNE